MFVQKLTGRCTISRVVNSQRHRPAILLDMHLKMPKLPGTLHSPAYEVYKVQYMSSNAGSTHAYVNVWLSLSYIPIFVSWILQEGRVHFQQSFVADVVRSPCF